MREWHHRWFIPLSVVGLLLLVVWWLMSSSPLARLRASGAPTELIDLIADPIPDEVNVAAGIDRLGPSLEKTAVAVADRLDALDQASDPAKAVQQAKRLLEAEAQLIDDAHKAIDRPRYASLIQLEEISEAVFLPKVQAIRSVGRLLSLECRVALAEQRTEEAARLTIDAMRFARRIEREPATLVRLVACALQTRALNDAALVVAQPDLSAESASRLDEALAELEDRSSLRWALESERVLAREKLRQMPFYVRIVERPGVMRVFERAIEAVETPLDGLAKAGNRAAKSTGMFGSLFAPVVQSSFEADARVGLQARGLRESLRDMRAFSDD